MYGCNDSDLLALLPLHGDGLSKFSEQFTIPACGGSRCVNTAIGVMERLLKFHVEEFICAPAAAGIGRWVIDPAVLLKQGTGCCSSHPALDRSSLNICQNRRHDLRNMYEHHGTLHLVPSRYANNRYPHLMHCSLAWPSCTSRSPLTRMRHVNNKLFLCCMSTALRFERGTSAMTLSSVHVLSYFCPQEGYQQACEKRRARVDGQHDNV